MSKIAEVLAGILVEVVIFGFVGIVLYRALAGKFLIPKREIVLPNQRGVLVQGERVLRVLNPGVRWIRPGQKVILLDARPRPLQFFGIEVLCSDGGVVRVSVTGEFCLDDPEIYYQGSTSANDAFLTEVRFSLISAARTVPADAIVAAPRLLERLAKESIEPRAKKLGLKLGELEVREAVWVGKLTQPAFEDPTSTTVH